MRGQTATVPDPTEFFRRVKGGNHQTNVGLRRPEMFDQDAATDAPGWAFEPFNAPEPVFQSGDLWPVVALGQGFPNDCPACVHLATVIANADHAGASAHNGMRAGTASGAV